MFKFLAPLLLSTLIFGCSTSPRKPAQATDVNAPVHSLATPLYSWSSNPALLTDTNKVLMEQFAWVSSCNPKIAANPEGEVQGCEGNGLAAGPGLYVSDNPFSSHDYGTYLVVVTPYANRTNIGNGTGIPPSGTMDRQLTGDARLDAIIYDFRATDLNTRALVVRGSGLLDLSKTKTYSVNLSAPKSFARHPAFACGQSTAAGEILKNWGDHLEFLSLTYNSFSASEGNGFAQNGELNVDGLLAATVSDMVAMSDTELKTVVANLNKKFAKPSPPIDDGSCREVGGMTLRNCFYNRMYKSVVGDMGTPRYPTNAWELPLTLKILQELKQVSAAEAKSLNDNQQLTQFLTKRFAQDKNRKARATEAYGCMNSLREQISKNHFGMWAE